MGDILQSYIKWVATNEQQKQNDLPQERKSCLKVNGLFVQSAMLGNTILCDEMERRELPDDVLRSLKEDIPQRGDIADGL